MGCFRKKPVEVEAVQFTGDNWAEMHAFTGHSTTMLGQEDTFQEFTYHQKRLYFNSNLKAAVWDKLDSMWVYVAPGEWIIKDAQNAFSKCDEDLFVATYEEVTE